MDIIGILIALLVFGCLFYLGFFIINKCFAEPIRPVALAILGVVFLIILLSYASGNLPLGGHALVIK